MFLCSCVFFRKGPMGARSCDPGSACPFHPAGKPHIYWENTMVWMPINQNPLLLGQNLNIYWFPVTMFPSTNPPEVWVLDIPAAASPATNSKLWPWRAWCPRWRPGRDDPPCRARRACCRSRCAGSIRPQILPMEFVNPGSGWGFSVKPGYHGKIKKDWTADCLVPWASLEPGCGLWKSATFGGIKGVKLSNLPKNGMLSNWILNNLIHFFSQCH